MPVKDPKELFLLMLSHVREGAEHGKEFYQELGQMAQDPHIKEALAARTFVSDKVISSLDQCFKLIGKQPVGFPMNSNRSLFIWRFDQAEDLAAILVEPVAQVFDAVLRLRLQVGGMGLGHRIRGEPFDMSVRIHKQWHEVSPYAGARPTNALPETNSSLSKLNEAKTHRSER